MSQTTNYSIPFIPEGAQDWKQSFDEILESLDATLAKNRRPASATLSWGDISGGMYLESTSLGIRSHGSMDMLGNPTRNFVIESFSTLPASGYYGQIAVQTSNNTPYIYLNGTWRPFAIPSTGYGGLGIINTVDHYTGTGRFIARANNGALAEIGGSANGQLLGWDGSQPVYRAASTWVGGELARGSLWTSTAAGLAANGVALNLPADALAAVGGDHVLVGTTAATTGLAWKTLRSSLTSALTNKGEILVGTSTGGTYISAPTSNQILVGNTSTATGWQLKNIDDIVPANTASNSTALIFANANLG